MQQIHTKLAERTLTFIEDLHCRKTSHELTVEISYCTDSCFERTKVERPIELK